MYGMAKTQGFAPGGQRPDAKHAAGFGLITSWPDANHAAGLAAQAAACSSSRARRSRLQWCVVQNQRNARQARVSRRAMWPWAHMARCAWTHVCDVVCAARSGGQGPCTATGTWDVAEAGASSIMLLHLRGCCVLPPGPLCVEASAARPVPPWHQPTQSAPAARTHVRRSGSQVLKARRPCICTRCVVCSKHRRGSSSAAHARDVEVTHNVSGVQSDRRRELHLHSLPGTAVQLKQLSQRWIQIHTASPPAPPAPLAQPT